MYKQLLINRYLILFILSLNVFERGLILLHLLYLCLLQCHLFRVWLIWWLDLSSLQYLEIHISEPWMTDHLIHITFATKTGCNISIK